MDPVEMTQIGTTSLKVTRLGIGGVAVGQVSTETEAVNTLNKCLELGVRYFDTAPLYGGGLSEERYGMILPTVSRSTLYDFHQGRAVVGSGSSSTSWRCSRNEPNQRTVRLHLRFGYALLRREPCKVGLG